MDSTLVNGNGVWSDLEYLIRSVVQSCSLLKLDVTMFSALGTLAFNGALSSKTHWLMANSGSRCFVLPQFFLYCA